MLALYRLWNQRLGLLIRKIQKALIQYQKNTADFCFFQDLFQQ